MINKDGCGKFDKFIHWLMALNILATLLVLHKGLYWVIVTLLLIQVAAALKHHFVDRDDVLIRMLPFVKNR